MITAETGALYFLRRGALVQRYHTEPGMAQSVGFHSYGVAVLIARFCNNPGVSLLKAALYHDLGEQVVGDVPSMQKWANSDLAHTLDAAEEAELIKHGCEYPDLDSYQRLWLHTCDRLDGILWCCDQSMITNNRNAYSIAHRFWQRIDKDRFLIEQWGDLQLLVQAVYDYALMHLGDIAQ